MEDEEDDVFEPDPHCWRTTFKEIKCEERATQTPGPVPASNNGMLPCGVAEEPRPLFYGESKLKKKSHKKEPRGDCFLMHVTQL